MRFLVIVVFLMVSYAHAEDFITEFEYGQMLYHDPHGASCAECHGEVGEGAVISSYIDKEGNKIELTGPDIRQATLKQITQSLKDGAGVMPRYFLADKEIRTLHAYIQVVNKRRKHAISKLFGTKSTTDNNISTKEKK